MPMLRNLKVKIEAHLTLREKIVESIRDAIINGDLPSGTRVAEPELAERFGISRTPIREAFRQLESEGFLTVVPRKGAVVATLSAKDVAEFYDLKAVLEGYAARLAAERLSDRDLQRMETLNRQIEAAAAKKEWRRITPFHNEFHDIFLSAAGNERLRTLVNQLVAQFQRYRMHLSMSGRIERLIEQHNEIIDAFRAKDASRAEAVVHSNAMKGKEILLRELAKG